MQDEFTQKIIEEIRTRLSADKGIDLPPKVFRDMQGRFTAHDPGRSLQAVFPVLERYQGPTGVMQGGIVVAAFDNIYGPFAYLTTASYCVTMNLNTSFVRPMTARDDALTIEVSLVERTKQFLLLDGKATNPQGKLIAHSTSQWFIVPAA